MYLCFNIDNNYSAGLKFLYQDKPNEIDLGVDFLWSVDKKKLPNMGALI